VTETSADGAAIATAQAGCPGLEVDGVLYRSGKALVLSGSLHGRPVVAKLLTSTDDLWTTAFARELIAYMAFAASPPPVGVPAVHAADAERGLLVIDRVDALPAALERYPGPLPTSTATALLATASALARWSPPAGRFARVFAYAERIDLYHRYGLLDVKDRSALRALLHAAEPAGWEFAHGDLLPTNLYLADAGPTLIDWEFAGFYLPGHDLALLWVLLAATPEARTAIENLAVAPTQDHDDQERRRAAFLLNLAMALTRELRIHAELPEDAERAQRLESLQVDWAVTRERVRDVAARWAGEGTSPTP
jgi:hypothetical protein